MNRELLFEPEPEKVPGTFSGARRWKLPRFLVRVSWRYSTAALAAVCVVLFIDSRIADALNIALGIPPQVLELPDRHGINRFTLFFALVAGWPLPVIALSLFIGPAEARTVRRWLAFTALIAGWLAVVGLRHDIGWLGQRWRIGGRTEAFETIAAPLRAAWPDEDGATKSLGPFSAYPIGKPTMLMPLTARTAGGLRFTSVERSPAGALRFQLGGAEMGTWLEWHPEGEAPASFVGGLEARYELERASPLGEGWFLVRYR